jgi:hypothetical protein
MMKEEDEEDFDGVYGREEFGGFEEEEEEGVEWKAEGGGKEGFEDFERMAMELKEKYPVRSGRMKEEADDESDTR